ncbi:MAG TPA: hypothetical protein VG893_05600 [Terracidiphilus sp.]|nr:hypothetical protein [Terracidiphilus sp.]
MLLSMLQIAAVALIALYLGWWRLGSYRRTHRSWESMLARLRQGWNIQELSEHFPWKEGLSITPDRTWIAIGGNRGLWAMYRNAGIMMEMADFAARHAGVDQVLLEVLRADAAQIRMGALKAILQYSIHQASESVRLRTFHVASMYTGMTAHMTEFLQNHAEVALPSFVAAM